MIKEVKFEELMNQEVRVEMATMCEFKDGYGIKIEVYSNDHGKLDYDKVIPSNQKPAHAHVYLPEGRGKGELVGFLNITGPVPTNPNDINEYVKGNQKPVFTTDLKKLIYNWAVDMVKGRNITATNWAYAQSQWYTFQLGK